MNKRLEFLKYLYESGRINEGIEEAFAPVFVSDIASRNASNEANGSAYITERTRYFVAANGVGERIVMDRRDGRQVGPAYPSDHEAEAAIDALVSEAVK